MAVYSRLELPYYSRCPSASVSGTDPKRINITIGDRLTNFFTEIL